MLIHWVLGEAGTQSRVTASWLQEADAGAPEVLTADPLGLKLLAAWLEGGAPAAQPEGPAGAQLEIHAEPEQTAEGTSTPRAQAPVKLGPTPPPAVLLRRQSVLALANGGVVPRGVSREAAGGMPAGLEILQGGALGIGWFPGDRLTHVEGVPVFERGLVVSKVLELRSRRASAIRATMARRTAEGVVSYLVVVEQPYLESESPAGTAPEGSRSLNKQEETAADESGKVGGAAQVDEPAVGPLGP